MGFRDRLKSAWNAFNYDEHNRQTMREDSYGYHNDFTRQRKYSYSKGSIIDMITTKIAVDVSMVEFKHVKMDGDPQTEMEVNDGLNRCLRLEANIDQTSIDFFHEITQAMFQEGVVAVVPVDTDINPYKTPSYNILSMRVGKIVQEFAQSVQVEIYNERNGLIQTITVPKKTTAIIPNPLWEICNGNNSVAKRLTRKLAILDQFDDGITSNKLDLILQMPYTVKGASREEEAKKRINSIAKQLKESEYGVAYIGETEHITQLNRPVTNNLWDEIKNLEDQLLNQLGLTKAVFDGTANEQELLAYYNRTIAPICKRIAMEFNRKFLTDTARTQGHEIIYYQDPFKLAPLKSLADSADTFRRNSILTANEIRQIIGFQRSDDPAADQLFNPNIDIPGQEGGMPPEGQNGTPELDSMGNEIQYDENGEPFAVDENGQTYYYDEEGNPIFEEAQ